MARKGRLLEIIVKSLEDFLSPEGINVKSPEEFHDERGVKIGEIDVTLRGKIGSATIFVGLECRERPSKGKQGVDWITQIRGKQILFGADKMIAISNTGFTDQAIDSANQLGIELRVIESIDNIDLTNWFETIEIVIPTGSHIDNDFEITGIIDLKTMITPRK